MARFIDRKESCGSLKQGSMLVYWLIINLMNDDSCRQLFLSFLQVPSDDADRYEWIRILRISIIFFSTAFLLTNIVLIIKRKQYKFNTIKLFMFVEIFYVISLLSVTPHSPSFNLDFCEFGVYRGEPALTKTDFFNCIITSGEEYYTAIEGYVNMLCYALSYWFAVCITLYIRHVLENTHRNFMRKRGPLIFSICFFIAIWFLVPFSLAFLEDVPFSFGPAGYQLYSVSEYFLYSGIINRDDSTLGQILVIVWMLALPLTLFAYHIYLLCKNQDYIKRLIKLDEINPRQYFIIKSGKLSFIIFFVQIFNVSKLVFSLVLQDHEDQNPIAQIILFSLNIVFDLLPIILIVIYFKYYYRQGRALQEKSDLMDRSLASSFTSATII